VASKSSSYRFALVTFKDHPAGGGEPGDYPSQVDLNFGSDVVKFESVLDGLAVSGGGDWEESVYSGAMAGLNLDWRPGVKKAMIVLGDAPPKDPEPITGFTAAGVAKTAYDIDPVEIYAVDTGGMLSPSMQSLVDSSGGKSYSTWSGGNVPQLITDALATALNKPFGWLQGPISGLVGDPIVLDARGSYATAGSLTQYEWDFNGDNTYELTTPEPVVNHIFASPFSGTVGVRVTASNGQSAVGSAQAAIVQPAPEPAPDETPKDKEGVYEVLDGNPLPFTTNPPPSPSPAEEPSVSLSADTITPGTSIAVTGQKFPSSAAGTVILHSNPVELGTFQTDAAGNVVHSVTIPTDVTLGAHEIEVRVGDVTARATLNIVAGTPASAPSSLGPVNADITPAGVLSPDSNVSSPAEEDEGRLPLPWTGAANPLPWVSLGTLFVAVGATAFLLTQRRKRARH
jgi:PKD domain